MAEYKTKAKPLSGTNYHEIRKKALDFYQQIKNKTKRKPYVRSAYFKKEKVFLDLFWAHVFHKNYWDQTRRMKYLPCAIELIQKSRLKPISDKLNPNKSTERLYRFAGIAANGDKFRVQIKESRNSGKKYLISVFPE